MNIVWDHPFAVGSESGDGFPRHAPRSAHDSEGKRIGGRGGPRQVRCNRFRSRRHLVLCVWLVGGGWAWSQAPSPQKKPIAVVAGEAIYDEDLLPLIQGQMQQLRRQEYEAKSKALEGLLNQKLLEAEAKKRGVPVEKLLEQEADARVSAPTDAEVEAFYAAQRDRINRPLEEVKAQIQQLLRQGKVEQARQAFLDTLREHSEVAVYLQPPRVEVSYDPARVRGDAGAPITIVEFSDFQCPFCERSYPVIKELLAKYQGQVKLAYRDFPLRQIHPQAQSAAEAARCAGEQGKFWQYHDRLFENQNQLNGIALLQHAVALELDQKQFDGCLASGKFREQIEQDFQDGNLLGVNGTPAFFINGVVVSGAQPAAVFEKVVKEELSAIRQSRPAQ